MIGTRTGNKDSNNFFFDTKFKDTRNKNKNVTRTRTRTQITEQGQKHEPRQITKKKNRIA